MKLCDHNREIKKERETDESFSLENNKAPSTCLLMDPKAVISAVTNADTGSSNSTAATSRSNSNRQQQQQQQQTAAATEAVATGSSKSGNK